MHGMMFVAAIEKSLICRNPCLIAWFAGYITRGVLVGAGAFCLIHCTVREVTDIGW
jgi:hypothetical protein